MNHFSVFSWDNRLLHAQKNAIQSCYTAANQDWKWTGFLSFLLYQTILSICSSLIAKITICFVENRNVKAKKIEKEMKEVPVIVTFHDLIADGVQRGPSSRSSRVGMFGVSSLSLYRSKKRAKLEEFDGIRSILSHRYISCLFSLSPSVYLFCVIRVSFPLCVSKSR